MGRPLTSAALKAAAKQVGACGRLTTARDLLYGAEHGPAPSQAVRDLLAEGAKPLVREALTEHLDHRALDYFGKPAEWGRVGMSALNAVGPFARPTARSDRGRLTAALPLIEAGSARQTGSTAA